jgi:hypothetical protein
LGSKSYSWSEHSPRAINFDRNGDAIAAVCRRPDGVPLAIELVAARVNTLGLEVLANLFEDSCCCFSKGRRTSSARHQSLTYLVCRRKTKAAVMQIVAGCDWRGQRIDRLVGNQ